MGRYVLLDQLGSGGMGTVFAAYDPELDRKVALKLVRSPFTHGSNGTDRAWLLREAQALARLSHPNVVAVYDVGMLGDYVWIAMEFVAGLTLRTWAKARHRGWAEVLHVLIEAARGVATAHAAGLVHRDLKPDNVMIGNDGRVRVMDFGLAHGRTIASIEPALAATFSASTQARPEFAALALRLTQSGAILGTPAYMAPEQWQGQQADVAADQFGWSVMAWELLYGEAPFAGATIVALAAMVLSGQRRAPPRDRRVPSWLRRVVERGLAREPGRRWPTMAALLAALERGRTRARAQTAGLLVVGAALSVGAIGYLGWGTTAREDPCLSAGGELVDLWDPAASAAVHAGILATHVPFAEDTWTRLQPRLDTYAGALVDMRVDACRDHEEGRGSTRMFDLRTACLDQRHASLATLVDILQRADGEVVGNAAAAAAALPPVAYCGYARVLTDAMSVPDDPGQALRVARLRSLLAEAQAHEITGQFARGLELIDSADVDDLDHLPALAELGLRRGSLLSEAGRHTEAEAVLGEALRLALGSGHDVAAAAIATRRDFVRVARLQLAQHVLMDAATADGLIVRMEAYDQGSELRGDYLNNLGIAHALLGHEDIAEAQFVASIAERTKAFGADHPQVVYALGNLGLVLLDGTDIVKATRQLDAAFLAAQSTLGPKHPHVALIAVNLGTGQLALGRFREASALLSRALALQTELLGPDAPDLHYVLSAIGDLEVAQRRCDEADESYLRALHLLGQGDAHTHPGALQPLLGLAKVAACRGDFVKARIYGERALALGERSHGESPPELLDGVGDIFVQSGDLDQALVHYQRAEASRRVKLPPGSRRMNESLKRIAEVYRRQGRHDAAAELLRAAQGLLGQEGHESPATSLTAAQIEASLGALTLDRGELSPSHTHYQRAAAIFAELGDPDTLELALARFGQARALAAQASALPPEARSLADEALKILRARGPAFAPEAQKITAWLAAHAPP